MEKRIPLALDVLLKPDGPDEIIVPTNEAQKIRAWASALPGWDEGATITGEPLVFLDEELLDTK